VVGSKVHLNSLYWSGLNIHLCHWCMVQHNVNSLLTLYIEVDPTFILESQMSPSSLLVLGATHVPLFLTYLLKHTHLHLETSNVLYFL